MRKPTESPFWQAARPRPRAIWVLPVPAVAERDDILTTLDVFASRQLQNQHLVERCDGLEVEAVEAFDGGEPGLSDPPLDHAALTVDQFQLGQTDKIPHMVGALPNPKNRVDLETEEAVVAYAVEYPAHGQVRVSNELRKGGVFVSPSGVRSIWLRHDLAHFKARLKALEAKVAEEGIILTEGQIQAPEKKKLDDEARGEIDTAHPGYLGSQDTFYVGTLKGVGRV